MATLLQTRVNPSVLGGTPPSSSLPLRQSNRRGTAHEFAAHATVLSAAASSTAAVLSSVKWVRKQLSHTNEPAVEEVVQSGMIDDLVIYLRRTDAPELQFEAAWSLTNICSGTSEQTAAVVHAGVVNVFVKMVKFAAQAGVAAKDLGEQAMWGLGNIAGDCTEFRDMVLQSGVLAPLLTVIRSPESRVVAVRNAAWLLSNLCRKQHQMASPNAASSAGPGSSTSASTSSTFDLLQFTLPTLAMLLQNPDLEARTDAAWCISYLSDGPNERIQKIVDTDGLVAGLVEIIAGCSDCHSPGNKALLTPALRSLGNIVTGSAAQTQAVLNAAALPQIKQLIRTVPHLRKECLWALSNVLAGTNEQVEAVLTSNIMPLVTQVLISPAEKASTRKEAAWCFANALHNGTAEQIATLATARAIHAFSVAANSISLEPHVAKILECLLAMLDATVANRSSHPMLEVVASAGVVGRLIELARLPSGGTAAAIVQRYFPSELAAATAEPNTELAEEAILEFSTARNPVELVADNPNHTTHTTQTTTQRAQPRA